MSKALISKSIIAFTLVGGGVFIYLNPEIYRNWFFRNSDFKKTQRIQKEANTKAKALLSSETAKWISQKDWLKIESLLGGKDHVAKAKFCRESIFIFSNSTTKEMFLEQGKTIYSLILDNTLTSLEPAKGKVAVVKNLCSKLLQHIGEPNDNLKQRQLSLMERNDLDETVRQRLLEAAATWRLFPKEAQLALEKMIFSSELRISRNGLQILNTIRDKASFRNLLLASAKKLKKLDQLAQPLLFKMITLNKSQFGQEYDQYLAYAQSKQSEAWIEAYVFAVERESDFKNIQEIKEMRSRTTNPYLLNRINRLVVKVERR